MSVCVERFVIIVTSLARDFLPSSWHYYQPTIYDLGMLAGSFGIFLTSFFFSSAACHDSHVGGQNRAAQPESIRRTRGLKA